MFHYSYTVKNISHSPAARAKKYLFYIRIKTFIYIQLCNTRVKKAISAQRPNGKNGSMYTRVDIFSYTTRMKNAIPAQTPNSKDVHNYYVLKIPLNH